MKRCIVFCILSILCTGYIVNAQTLDEARELYKIGEFGKALPIFEQEYKAKPTDAPLNQWYGVCLYETNKDISKAEECISFAAKKGIPEAFLYLGKIYTRTYRFKEATVEFDQYAKLKRRDKEALSRLEKEKELLSTLKSSALRTEDVQIIDSIVVDKNDFLSAYKLSPSSGHISYYNSMFPNEKQSKSTIYSNEKESKIYYAKPSNGDTYSLFSMENLIGGFGNEKKLSANNFELSGDLNFPFVMADGVTIYFSAQDKNGLGGYDIYVTRYNMNNDTYLTPERLTMPFNSFYNDYMMAVDEEKGVGWFATDRFQSEGKVCIYTFIPNSQINLVEDDDDSYVVKRAVISSIKDSWKPDVNYSNVIALARKDVKEAQKVVRDFEFVINDEYTYYLFSDFKNPKALEMFRQLSSLKNNLKDTENRLENLRSSYRSSQSSAKANDIIELEHKQAQLYNEAKELEIKTRNQEVQSLKR